MGGVGVGVKSLIHMWDSCFLNESILYFHTVDIVFEKNK